MWVEADFRTEGKGTSLLYQNGKKNWDREISEMSSALLHVSTSCSKCGVKLICFVVFVVIGVLIVLAKLSSEFQSLVACKNRVIDICLSRHRNSAIIPAVSHILIKNQNNPELRFFQKLLFLVHFALQAYVTVATCFSSWSWLTVTSSLDQNFILD